MNIGKKFTGGKYHSRRKLRLHERKGRENPTSLGENKTKSIRIMGGNHIQKLLRANIVNISVNGKTQKAEIKNVMQTPQNTFLARQNRLMKGAVILTSIGKAKITNRPTREGSVNAILIE